MASADPAHSPTAVRTNTQLPHPPRAQNQHKQPHDDTQSGLMAVKRSMQIQVILLINLFQIIPLLKGLFFQTKYFIHNRYREALPQQLFVILFSISIMNTQILKSTFLGVIWRLSYAVRHAWRTLAQPPAPSPGGPQRP